MEVSIGLLAPANLKQRGARDPKTECLVKPMVGFDAVIPAREEL